MKVQKPKNGLAVLLLSARECGRAFGRRVRRCSMEKIFPLAVMPPAHRFHRGDVGGPCGSQNSAYRGCSDTCTTAKQWRPCSGVVLHRSGMDCHRYCVPQHLRESDAMCFPGQLLSCAFGRSLPENQSAVPQGRPARRDAPRPSELHGGGENTRMSSTESCFNSSCSACALHAPWAPAGPFGC